MVWLLGHISECPFPTDKTGNLSPHPKLMCLIIVSIRNGGNVAGSLCAWSELLLESRLCDCGFAWMGPECRGQEREHWFRALVFQIQAADRIILRVKIYIFQGPCPKMCWEEGRACVVLEWLAWARTWTAENVPKKPKKCKCRPRW